MRELTNSDEMNSPSGRERFLQKMAAGHSRTLMASGGDEPVADGGGSGHSVFAAALLRGLLNMDKGRFTARELFDNYILEYVAGSAEQTPVYDPLRNSGHESGDFVFSRVPPDLQLRLRRVALAAQPGQSIQLPITITNSGNHEDSFKIVTDLPAEYQPTFSQSGNDTGMPIFVTPQMQRGASIEVTLNARVPESAPDNQQQRFLVRAASQADSTVTKAADASLTVVAAALNAGSSALQENVQPGDTFTQRITVKNQGSATALQTRADFVFNPDFELVSATPAPIQYDRPSRTAIWSLGDLESRDNREITVTLRANPAALAGANKPVGRGALYTKGLSAPWNFDGPTINVGRVAGARVDAVSKGLTATPGDTMYIPFIVRNPSNYPESFDLRIVAPGAPNATVYADTNGDGLHQSDEPTVTQTAPLDPRGGQYNLLLAVEIPRTTPDRTQFAYNLVTRAMNATGRVMGEDSTVITVIAPRVRVRFEPISSRHAAFASPLHLPVMKPVGRQQDDTASQAEQDTFNRGRALFAKRKYNQAATVFRDFLKAHPDSFIADLMLLWLGRSYIEMGKLQEAEGVAQRLHAMKDTPFTDIYDTELEQAKRERAAGGGAVPRRTPTQDAHNSQTPSPAVRDSAEVRPRTRGTSPVNGNQADSETGPGTSGVQEAAAGGESPMGLVVPGDTIFYRLVLVNDGGGIAKNLSVMEFLPETLEFVSSSPAVSAQDFPGGGRGFVWRVAELGPGDTMVLQVAVRFTAQRGLRLTPDDVVKARHTLTYQDLNSNIYRGM